VIHLGVANVNYYEPWWIQIVKSLVIFLVAFAILPMLTVYERKLLGRLQGRYGPNRVGPFGLLQPMAEIVKFTLKEPSRPTTSVGFLFRIAPAIAILTAIGALLVPGTSRRSSARRSACMGSTCRSGRCTCSPSPASRSTGFCSAAGRRARSTRSSARCAGRPS
jgi:hypothetical protein